MLSRQGWTRGRMRRAAAALWALFAMTTMLVALALALNAGWLSTARLELQTATDAAALAAAEQLVSDAWLRQDKAGVAALFQEAGEAARDFAAMNRVLGRPLVLDISPPNSGDVIFGSYNPTKPGTLARADISDPTTLSLDDVNTVAVTGRRSRVRGTGVPILLGALVLRPAVDMRADSLAYLDRDVIGFRAGTQNPIPLVPLGLRSDPTAADTFSWEYRIQHRNGPDEFRFTPGSGFVAGTDQIPEIDLELQLKPSGDPTLSSVTVLTIGQGPLATQVNGGVTADDLAGYDGKLVLGSNNTLTLPGSGLGPEMGSAEYEQFRQALEKLRDSAAVRVWPLVSKVEGGQATVNAFVAARVVRIEEPSGGPLRIRLQPAMLAVPQVITDYSRRGTAHLLPSDYLAKPKLVR